MHDPARLLAGLVEGRVAAAGHGARPALSRLELGFTFTPTGGTAKSTTKKITIKYKTR
jgi:hypothetical protein